MKKNKQKHLILLTLTAFFSGCAQQAQFPVGVNSSASFGEGQQAGSLHDKYSQEYADKHIIRGKDNAMTIGMKFGQATFSDKNGDSDTIWAYQARSAIVSTDAKMGTNLNTGLFSASTASASNINTETMSKVTTLRIIFDANGTVKDYYSEREMN